MAPDSSSSSHRSTAGPAAAINPQPSASSQRLLGLPLLLKDIQAAAERIRDAVVTTPVLSSESLNAALGLSLWFKCENLQHGGAFKARGACHAVGCLTPEEAAAGVVTHSSGNHAAALARAAVRRGIRAHIVMPRNSAAVKLAAVRRLGVEPLLCEPTAVARETLARQVMEDTGAVLIHPYNDVRVMAGQGTVALELLQQLPDLQTVVVPVGGGGLLSGMLVALKSLRPEITVFAAEPQLADDAARSLRSGCIEQPLRYDTIADGLRTPLGSLTFPIIQRLVDGVLLVDEATIVEATLRIQSDVRVVAEPSGAVSLGAVVQHAERFRGQRVAVVISGGNLDRDAWRPSPPAA